MRYTVKNFIKEKHIFDDIKNLLMSEKFPYFYYNYITHASDQKHFFFCHVLYRDGESKSPFFNQILMPLLGRLDFNYLHRAKVNLYTQCSEPLIAPAHSDIPIPHRVALFSINNNNGYTLFEDGTKISSVENECIVFDGKLKHSSVSQTNEKIRININLNLS